MKCGYNDGYNLVYLQGVHKLQERAHIKIIMIENHCYNKGILRHTRDIVINYTHLRDKGGQKTFYKKVNIRYWIKE